MQQEKIAALRQWMVTKGCKIHPHLTIPSKLNGIQGVSTNQPIPAKTLIVAIPSNLILTVSRCYNDPILKKLFLANDDLFDYQASEDAEFNVLCVFIMYHKLNIENSEWKAYLDTIAEPQTAVDWPDADLRGLNKSLIEEVIHVRIECQKLQNELVGYLMKRKEFKQFDELTLRHMFNYCYRAVMTRCFGYYFNQACLIPIADLINHGCQAIDHQLINVNFEKGREFHEAYYDRKEKINCELLDIQGPQKRNLPFRQKFLVQNAIFNNQDHKLAQLDRIKIDSLLYEWNKQRLKQGQKLQNLHFCSQDEEEDNDTEQQFEVEQIRELQHCKRTEQQQMKDFMTHFVTVEKYGDVEKKLQELQAKEQIQNQTQQSTKKQHEKQEEKMQEKIQQNQQNEQENHEQSHSKQDTIQTQVKHQQVKQEPKTQNEQKISKPQQKQQQIRPNPFSNNFGRGVPIQMVDSSSQQDEDEQQWGLKDGSYFTMASSSPLAANRQIYNSYGSRTNKFLLIWYGFTYPDNLYDSVSVRLQVQFGALRPAKQIVLDSYIGGQGLSFKKPNSQVVKQNEISRQFRFKRTNICENLLIFLRLYLMNYYKGQDLYKLFVTFPASCDFELFVLAYYKEIIESLYERYPLQAIQVLKNQMDMAQFAQIKFKNRYKVIYLEEQRKLLDKNLKAANQIIEILNKGKNNGNILERSMYEQLPIQDLRMIRKYLILYQKNKEYILYSQKQPQKQLKNEEDQQKIEENGEQQQQQQWQSQSDSEEQTQLSTPQSTPK